MPPNYRVAQQLSAQEADALCRSGEVFFRWSRAHLFQSLPSLPVDDELARLIRDYTGALERFRRVFPAGRAWPPSAASHVREHSPGAVDALETHLGPTFDTTFTFDSNRLEGSPLSWMDTAKVAVYVEFHRNHTGEAAAATALAHEIAPAHWPFVADAEAHLAAWHTTSRWAAEASSALAATTATARLDELQQVHAVLMRHSPDALRLRVGCAIETCISQAPTSSRPCRWSCRRSWTD